MERVQRDEEYKFGELSFLGVKKPKVVQLSIEEVRQAHASKGLNMSSYEIPTVDAATLATPMTHPLDLPNELSTRMYDHQKEGVQWMYDLRTKYKGGILGDDMGLGKTFQSRHLSYLFLIFSFEWIRITLTNDFCSYDRSRGVHDRSHPITFGTDIFNHSPCFSTTSMD